MTEQRRSEDREQQPHYPIFMERVIMNLRKNSPTSTGKKEAVRSVHPTLIGSRLRKPCVRACGLSGIELGPDEELYS